MVETLPPVVVKSPPTSKRELQYYPTMQPLRTKVFLPQGKLTDYSIFLDFNKLDDSLNSYHRLSNEELKKQEVHFAGNNGSPQTTIFSRVLQVCEASFPRM